MKLKLKFIHFKFSYSIIYNFIICIYALSMILSTSNLTEIAGIPLSTIIDWIRYFSIITLFFLIIPKNLKVKLKTIWICIFTFSIIFLVFLSIHDTIMILTFELVIAFKNESLDNVSNNLFKTMLFGILFILLLYYFGISSDVYEARTGTDRLGHSFGFLGANALATNIFVTLLYYLYKNRCIWNTKKYINFICISIISYVITRSRMVLLLEMITLIFIMTNKVRIIKRTVYFMSKLIYSVCAILSILLYVWYANNPFAPLQYSINLITTGRLYWTYYFAQKYGVSLFGQNIMFVGKKLAEETGQKWQSIDNTYAMLTIRYGIVLLILLCVIYYYLGKFMENTDNYIGAVCIILNSLWGLTESSPINPVFNITYFLIGEMLWTTQWDRSSLQSMDVKSTEIL